MVLGHQFLEAAGEKAPRPAKTKEMTAADKQARRRVRHQLQQDVKAALQRARMMGSYARTAQIQAAAKIVADRYLGLTRNVPTRVEPLPRG